MTVAELMQDIKDAKIPPYLVLFGDEYYVLQFYIKKMCEGEIEPIMCDSVVSALRLANKKQLVQKNRCYIVTDDADYLKQETKWEQTKQTFNQRNKIIIKYTNKIAKNTKFYKQNQDSICEFELLSDNVLLKHLPDLDEDVALSLIHICGNNYGRILFEYDKVKQFTKSSKIEVNEVAKKFIKEGIIHKDIGDITFSLTDAIIVGDMDKSSKFMHEAKMKKEPVIMVLSILYDNFKNMLLIQGLGSEQPTEENTGLSSKQIYAIKKKCGAYSNNELLRNMEIVRQAELDIKTGALDQDIALEYVITRLLA